MDTIRNELKVIEMKLKYKRKELKRKVRQARLQWIKQRVQALNGRGGHFVGDYWKAALEISGGPDQKHRRIQQSFRDPLTNEEEKHNLVGHLQLIWKSYSMQFQEDKMTKLMATTEKYTT